MKEKNYKSMFCYIFVLSFSVIIGKIKKVCGCSRTDVTEVELILSSVGFSGFVVSCGALLYHTKVNLIVMIVEFIAFQNYGIYVWFMSFGQSELRI